MSKQAVQLNIDFTFPPVHTSAESRKEFDTSCLNEYIKQVSHTLNIGELSDGYHTFNELYEFRKLYNAALFNEWAKPYWSHKKAEADGWLVDGQYTTHAKYQVHKSWRHHDGFPCFGGGWFIVVAMLPGGQISNHYEAKDWDLFQIPETERALFPFDGHTGRDVLQRLTELCKEG